MKQCSVVEGIEIVRGGIGDYERLGRFHYRAGKMVGYSAIFAMKKDGVTIGVIVYRMPSGGLELRNVATGGMFCGFDRVTNMELLNSNVRCISRVVIEPRFRGLGLASRLVRETVGLMGVPIVEALAVMGAINRFFEKAGMRAFRGERPERCVRMVEAFSMVGVEEASFVDAEKVGRILNRLGRLEPAQKKFIDFEIRLFLQSYGKRRDMGEGVERVRYVLSRLGVRPVYYIWVKKNSKVKV